VLSLELEKISAEDAGCTRIRQIPGIIPIVATAIVAAIDNGAAFRKVRVLPHDWGLCRGSILLVARRICSVSASEARGWMDTLEAKVPRNVIVIAIGQQACTHRVGRIVERRRLSPYTDDDVTSAEKTPTAWKRRCASILPHYDNG
jgi:hypothetical protein